MLKGYAFRYKHAYNIKLAPDTPSFTLHSCAGGNWHWVDGLTNSVQVRVWHTRGILPGPFSLLFLLVCADRDRVVHTSTLTWCACKARPAIFANASANTHFNLVRCLRQRRKCVYFDDSNMNMGLTGWFPAAFLAHFHLRVQFEPERASILHYDTHLNTPHAHEIYLPRNFERILFQRIAKFIVCLQAMITAQRMSMYIF